MSGEDRNANVVLTANTSNYAQQMSSAQTQTNTMLDSVNKLVAGIDRLTKQTGRKLEIISAGSVATIASATVMAARFEQQLSTLSATAVVSGRNVGLVRGAVDDLRRNLPMTTEQIVSLAAALGKMSSDPHNLERVVTIFAKLSAATGEDIGALAAGMLQLQQSMGTTSGSTGKFADTLTTLSANLHVSATGVLAFSQSIAPVARMVGMTQTEVMGFSAAFQKAGQDGFAASTVFTKMLTDISRASRYGSTDLAMFANLAGTTVKQFKDMSATNQLTSLLSAINKQGPEAVKTLEQMGYDGPRAIKAIQGLVQSGGLSQALNEATGSYGNDATSKGAAEAMTGLNDSLQKLRNNLTSIGQEFGRTFLPMATAVTDAFTKMAGVVRTVMGPISSILGVLTGAGAAGGGVMGFLASNFSTLAAAAGGIMLTKTALGSGMSAGRNVAAGRAADSSRFFGASVNSFEGGEGNRFQRAMYSAGRFTGAHMPTASGPGGVNVVGRLAYGASMMARAVPNTMSSMLDPARWRASDDITARGQSAKTSFASNWETLRTGEGATVGAALKGIGTSTLGFGRALVSATAGLGRFAATSVAAAAGGPLGLVKRGGSAMLGLMGGPAGLALMGGMAAGTYVAGAHSDQIAYGEQLKSANGEDSAINKYATALGTAGAAALSFAAALKSATGDIPTSASAAKQVSGADVTAAKAAGRKLTDSTFSGLNASQASAYAGTVLTGNSTPGTIQALKLDLIQRYGQQTAQKILSQSGTSNYNDVAGIVSLGSYGAFGGLAAPFKPTDEQKNTVAAATSAVDVQRANLTTKYGVGESNKYSAAAVNQMLDKFLGSGGVGPSQAQQVGLSQGLEQLLGGADLNIGDADQASLSNPKNSAQQRTDYLMNKILPRTEAGRSAKDTLSGVGSSLYSRTYAEPPAGSIPLSMLEQNVQGTMAGRTIRNGPNAGAYSTALNNPDDANANLSAATGLANEMSKAKGSTAAASLELEKLKAAVGNPLDPLYKLADAAQQATTRLQGYQTGFMTSGQRAQQVSTNLTNAYAAPSNSPDRQQNIIGAEDAYMSTTVDTKNKLKQMSQTFREFDISQARSSSDFTLSRSRADYQYNLQRNQSEQDYTLSKTRNANDYYVQLARGEDSYKLQRSQSQADFDKSRTRSEEDFNHQIEVAARQNARSIQDIYSRITTQPSWDATNLLGNSQDQLGKMQQQQGDLNSLRGMGVSGDVITTLGLNEFTNQQQLARFVSDLAQNPDLVTAWNEAIKGRLDISKAFVTDQNSDSYKEMTRSFTLAADRAVEDFKVMSDRSAAAYQLNLGYMGEDFQKMTARSDADYKKMVDRQSAAYALSVAQTVTDWNVQVGRAKDDLNRSFEEVTGTFDDLAVQVMGRLTGTTKSQMDTLLTALGTARAAINTATGGVLTDLQTSFGVIFGVNSGASGNPILQILKGAGGGSMGASNPIQKIMTGQGGGAPGNGMGGGETASVGGSSTSFPLPGGSYKESSGFGMRVNPISHINMLHAGNDYAAPMGTPIMAARGGTVTKAGPFGGLGNMVEVTSPGGIVVQYGHMSQIMAQIGESVDPGTRIGSVGSTGNSTGPHLHFELHVNGKPVDPTSFLSGSGSAAMTAGVMGSASKAYDLAKFLKNSKGVGNMESALLGIPSGGAYQAGSFSNTLGNQIATALSKHGSSAMDSDQWYGSGGLFRSAKKIGVAERGAEAVLPLNERGADFLATTMSKFVSNGAEKLSVSGRPTVQSGGSTYHQRYDYSTDISGPITVQAADPNEMLRKLEEKSRMKKLLRPAHV